MTTRDVASFNLGLGAITYNWWAHLVDGLLQIYPFVLPTLGVLLVCLQIAYYWKKLRE